MDSLMCISPIDGRYREKVSVISDYFSEYALFKYRIKIEYEYLKALLGLDVLDHDGTESMLENFKKIYDSFDIESARRIKEIEKI